MGLSIVFTDPAGTDGPFSLASANGWRLFAEWAESLPVAFPLVRELVHAGGVARTDQLPAQLTAALDRCPPANAAVAHTARNLLELLGVGDAAETATVTDGE